MWSFFVGNRFILLKESVEDDFVLMTELYQFLCYRVWNNTIHYLAEK